jgi:hypothetical protein
MNEADSVHCRKRRREVHRDVDRLMTRKRASLKSVSERLPLHQLHREIRQIVNFADLEHGWQVGMVDASKRNRLSVDPARPSSTDQRQLDRARSGSDARPEDDRKCPAAKLVAQLDARNVNQARQQATMLTEDASADRVHAQVRGEMAEEGGCPKS